MKIEINDNQKWQYSQTIKMVLLAILGLMFLIPLEMIKSVIRERQNNSENVKKEIASQWASAQTVSGPVLNIPVRSMPVNKEAEPTITIFHIMPEALNITGSISAEKRYRSIYQAVVYSAELILSGEFVIPAIPVNEGGEVLWEEAYYTLGISDNRGLRGNIILKTTSSAFEATPGLTNNDLFLTGISFPANIRDSGDVFPFTLNLNLAGSESLNFAPVGKTTEVRIQSQWNSPGFKGNFLPSKRSIDKNGFRAEWLVTNLNRNFPQHWSGESFKPDIDSFGVDFVLVVDHYQKSLRSAKYGILFIALTFLALLFVELSSREKINTFQYFLISLGLVLFFSLLNSLSEHTGFNIAYLLSAASTIILISGFLRMIVKKPRPVLIIAILLTMLYSFIFILLTLNDYAYLAGNIGLFILLALIMRLSAKVNLFKSEDNSDMK